MRLDKYLSETGTCSRTDASRACRKGNVTVNGEPVKSAAVKINEETDRVTFMGKEVVWRRFTYVMLNKPAGYVSSTEESGDTVMTLLPPEFSKMNMFPCGRLDKDTLGLLLITNDGQTAHKLLSPKKHVAKRYRYGLTLPLSEEGIAKLEAGVDIGGYVTGEAKVYPADDRNGEIVISEGKYHQIKRMFHAVGTEIETLERVEFGALKLDGSLERGEWRYLEDDEIAAICGSEEE